MAITEISNQTLSGDSAVELSQRERLDRLERFGHWLDTALKVPGTNFRIGWDAIIGLVPVVGDLTTTAMSAWIIHEARQMGVSKWTLGRMLANTGIDTLVGSIPLLGDLFDAKFKSNKKNIALLKRHLRKHKTTVETKAA